MLVALQSKDVFPAVTPTLSALTVGRLFPVIIGFHIVCPKSNNHNFILTASMKMKLKSLKTLYFLSSQNK